MAKQATGHRALGTRRMWLIIIASHLLVAGLALLLIEGAALVRLTLALDKAKSVSSAQMGIPLLLFVLGALLALGGGIVLYHARHYKEKLRRGNARLMVHVVALIELAALLIAMGSVGLVQLQNATRAYYTTARTNVFKDKTNGLEAQIQAIMLENADNANRVKNNVISNRRKLANETIDRLSAEGLDEREVIASAAEVYVSRASEVFTQDGNTQTAEKIRAAVEAGLEEITSSLIERADAASASLKTKDVRNTMNATNTRNYIIIYYGRTFVIMGGACLVLAGLLLLAWLKRDEEARGTLGQKLEPFDYLLPFLVGVGVFTFYPMVRVLIMSFQENYHLTGNNLGEATGWGIGNYKFILSGRGSAQFLRSLRNTGLYVLFTVPITAAISIVVAYLLNQKTKLHALFQTAYFMPMVTTATAVGLVWRWMFNQNSGLINALINFFTRFFGAPENINWLQTGATNHTIPMMVLIIFGVWNSLPFTIILLLSGLQNIDEHLYTVAKVDGSKSARIFFKITVPLLSPTIGLVLIINSISAFKVYTDVFVLWNGKPEDYQMETVAWYIYNNITSNFDGMHSLGIAAAAAMVLFVIIFAFTMLQKLIQRKWVYQ